MQSIHLQRDRAISLPLQADRGGPAIAGVIVAAVLLARSTTSQYWVWKVLSGATSSRRCEGQVTNLPEA